MNLSPDNFICNEDYLSTLKTLILLVKDCKIYMGDDRCIYIILSKLGSAYYVFLSTFYATREALGGAYQALTLESFVIL
jgi:hypothetical protein